MNICHASPGARQNRDTPSDSDGPDFDEDDGMPLQPLGESAGATAPRTDSINDNDGSHSLPIDQAPGMGSPRVSSSDDNSNLRSRRLRAPRRKPRWLTALGTRGIWILAASFSVILSACSVLVYLWTDAQVVMNGDEPSKFWRYIVEEAYATQVVTICAAAIRTSITFQMGLVTAAIAALLIETTGTSLADAALLSIKRASGAGPVELVMPGFRRGNRKSRAVSILYPTLAGLTIAMLLASTFFSTILLSDFANTEMGTTPIFTTLTVEPFDKRLSWTPGYTWSDIPFAAPRFAEAAPGLSGIDGRGIDSTNGTRGVVRAVLPFGNATQRDTLWHYTGATLVFPARTECYAPEPGSISLSTAGLNRARRNSIGIHGNITVEFADFDLLRDLAQLGVEEETALIPFRCESLIYSKDAPKSREWRQGGWPIIMCPADYYWDSESLLIRPYVLLNATGWPDGYANVLDIRELPLETYRGRGEHRDPLWISVRDKEAGRDFFKISVCFTWEGAILQTATMHSRSVSQEPVAVWNPGTTDKVPGWDVTALSNQFLARGSNPQDRGLMVLERGPFHFPLFNYSNASRSTRHEDDVSGVALMNMTNTGGFERHSWSPHTIYSSQFQSILQQSGLPLAVESLVARLWQTQFYSKFQESTEYRHFVIVAFATTASIPRRWTGLAVVLGIVAVDLILVITVVGVFLAQTRVSALWNPWQAVAQIVTPGTAVVTDGADAMATSREVNEWLAQGEDTSSGTYTVRHSADRGRQELQRVPQPDVRKRK